MSRFHAAALVVPAIVVIAATVSEFVAEGRLDAGTFWISVAVIALFALRQLVTTRHNVELVERLDAAGRDLERRVHTRTSELADANGRLRGAMRRLDAQDRAKAEFLNHVAHEVHTPLTPMALQLHLLRDGKLGPTNERQQGALDVAGRNVERLFQVVREARRFLDAPRDPGTDELPVAIEAAPSPLGLPPAPPDATPSGPGAPLPDLPLSHRDALPAAGQAEGSAP